MSNNISVIHKKRLGPIKKMAPERQRKRLSS